MKMNKKVEETTKKNNWDKSKAKKKLDKTDVSALFL